MIEKIIEIFTPYIVDAWRYRKIKENNRRASYSRDLSPEKRREMVERMNKARIEKRRKKKEEGNI